MFVAYPEIRFTSRSPMRRLFAALVFASLTACGKLGSDFGPQVEGKWTGSSDGKIITMDLLQTGNVTGIATIGAGTTGAITLAVSGTFNNPTLRATLSSSQAGQSIEMEATVTGRTMLGTLTGGGFTGQAIALTRQ
jgi:hypothetical protein